MEIRRPLEWHSKQMDHIVGLNFSANFNFALVGHLLKGKRPRARPPRGVRLWFTPVAVPSAGYRHPSPTTVARTVRILHTLLSLISKHLKCDKFEVNTHSVAYLAGGRGRRAEAGPSAACVALTLCSSPQRCSPFPRRSGVAAASSTGSLC